MSEKWDFSSCFPQAGCSAHRQGRRAVLGVVWWALGPDASPGGGGWGPDPSQMPQAHESSHGSRVPSP